jgi:hypothetical protein
MLRDLDIRRGPLALNGVQRRELRAHLPCVIAVEHSTGRPEMRSTSSSNVYVLNSFRTRLPVRVRIARNSLLLRYREASA